jgi:hypothetical protein
MSPRAAWQLERLGFGEVYDYAAGKAAWLALGLPSEGSVRAEDRASSVARRDVPTCRPDEAVREVLGRLGEWDVAVVVTGGTAEGVVLGVLIAHEASDAEPSTPAGEAMATAPSTFRPSITRRELAEWMDGQDGAVSRRTLLTTLDGRFVGVVCREDL